MNRRSTGEILAIIFGVTICIGLIMWFCYGVWGPHTPPKPLDPKTEYIQSCQFRSGIPDVHTNSWTCTKTVN